MSKDKQRETVLGDKSSLSHTGEGECSNGRFSALMPIIQQQIESHRRVLSAVVGRILELDRIDKLPLAKQSYLYEDFKRLLKELETSGYAPSPEELRMLDELKSRGLENVERALKATQRSKSTK